MYRALYSFQSDNSNALSFSVGDRFTALDSGRDQHWWMVQNGKGQVGYVPANYVKKDDVAHAEVLQSIDRAIEIVKKQSTDGETTAQQKNNLQKLLHHRQAVVEEHRLSENPTRRTSTRRPAPPPPRHPSTSISQHNECNSQKEKAVAEVKPMTNEHLTATASGDGGSSNTEQLSEAQLGALSAELVEKVRNNTQLSHQLSRVAVATVLTHLKDNVEPLRDTLAAILQQLIERKDCCSESEDESRLQYLFTQLAACKDDSQQRSWFLHEDEHVITTQLQELLSILVDADASICRPVVALDHYSSVHNLVLYYQMETRVSLRLLLLKVFGALCQLEASVISELLNSVLPLELVRDMQANVDDIQRLCFSALVLTMIFSIGQTPPIHHYEHFNETFVHFLLDHIETPPSIDRQEKIPDLFMNLLLAFNLHMEIPSENLVMRVLAESTATKVFTEKLLLLVNRAVDPVRMFNHHVAPPDSILKLLSDLFSSRATADLLYTNDAMVLIDIILRQLTDLSPGDPVRTEHLSLLMLLMQNSACLDSYVEDAARFSQVCRCFSKIANEETSDSERDKRILADIFQQFPQFNNQ